MTKCNSVIVVAIIGLTALPAYAMSVLEPNSNPLLLGMLGVFLLTIRKVITR